jgi:nicotinate-nucleotide pyrophosphorylase (carboxylating)
LIEPLEPALVQEVVRRALAEDVGPGDVTSESVVPAGTRGSAVLIARQACVVAGLAVFEACFVALDRAAKVVRQCDDGAEVQPGEIVATVDGEMRALLAAERTALNFLQRLSGIATLTRAFVRAARDVDILDTRKTTPGLRRFEKYAVRAGGGTNHRFGLSDAILLKDNHIAACGGVREAVTRARAAQPDLEIEVECERVDQVHEAVEAGAHRVLLDNMDRERLREAVRAADGRVRTEASGGVTLDNVAEIAATGVGAISVGALTHSAPAVDFSLEVEAI